MKFGTVILTILMIFICSYAGLGYLVKQSEDQVAEINRLKNENSALTSKVDQYASENKQLSDQLALENARANGLENQLVTERKLKEATMADMKSCQAAKSGTNLPGVALWGIFLVPALGLSFTAWQRLIHSPAAGKAEPVNASKVTVLMTRQQIAEYLKYQRGIR